MREDLGSRSEGFRIFDGWHKEVLVAELDTSFVDNHAGDSDNASSRHSRLIQVDANTSSTSTWQLAAHLRYTSLLAVRIMIF
jgi:hypothetical protein